MPCLNPVTIRVNGEVLQVPCGQCAFCRNSRANDWITRLKIAWKSGLKIFVTLTYSDENLPVIDDKGNLFRGYNRYYFYKPTFSKKDVQKFFKRLRKKGFQLQYYLCSEYGSLTLRPHYHFVAYFPCLTKQDYSSVEKAINEAWHLGFVDVGEVSDNRLRYVTKYASKYIPEVKDYLSTNEFLIPPFSLMSKKMGLDFVQQNFDFIRTHNFLFTPTGQKVHTPRYFRKKVQELLDENETIQMQSTYNASSFLDDAEFDEYCQFMHNSKRLIQPREHYKEHDSYFEFLRYRFEKLEYHNSRLINQLNKKSKI